MNKPNLEQHRKVGAEMYSQTVMAAMLEAQRALGFKPAALASDIDHTFAKKGMEAEMRYLYDWLIANNIPTLFVSGVDSAAIIRRIESGELSKAHAIAGAVGTELYLLGEDGKYFKDEQFEQQLISSGYVRINLLQDAMDMIREFATSHPEWNFDFQNPDIEAAYLTKQDPTYLPFKISFYYYGDAEEMQNVQKEVEALFPKQRILMCEEINYNSHLKPGETPKKYCLDILPVTKADVVRHVVKTFDIKEGVIAGDSGNDTDMLLNAPPGFVAVLVGGAKPEALRELDVHAPKKKGERSFRRDAENNVVYVEASDRIGPESILHAFQVLKRAQIQSEK